MARSLIVVASLAVANAGTGVMPAAFANAVGWQTSSGMKAPMPAQAAGWGRQLVQAEQASVLGDRRFRLGRPSNRRAVRPSMRAAAESPNAHSVGGERTEAALTALVAGVSVGLLCALGQFTQKSVGLPLWAPPLGAVSLIFSVEATAAAREGKIMSMTAILQRALKAGTAVAGACIIGVLVTRFVGASLLGRAVAVTAASLWMSAFPMSGYFPPTGAFCALYVDQSIAQGALAKLGLGYALFPCGAGTVILLVLSRLVAGVLARPLRSMQKRKQDKQLQAA